MARTLRSSSALLPEGAARLSWAAFDAAVDAMAGMVRELAPDACAIRGIPRGGLPLAVALSHRTGLPLAGPEDAHGIVVVDDVVETGQTLRQRGCAAILFLCWVSKSPEEVPARHVIKLPKSAWVIFPWEVAENAVHDAAEYLKRRGKI